VRQRKEREKEEGKKREREKERGGGGGGWVIVIKRWKVQLPCVALVRVRVAFRSNAPSTKD
jgi:hypothetical protein